jgi:hypothetical protein
MPILRNPFVAPRRVIFFHHRVPSVPAASEALALRGIDVRVTTDFPELAAWLVCWRGTAVALVELPQAEPFQATTLAAIRRLDPSIAIAPLVPGSSADQLTGQATELLTARSGAAVDEDLPEREAA